MQSVLCWCLLASVVYVAAGDDNIVQERDYYQNQMEDILDPKRKKPFCNAFTGCGKKRSDESMATLVELNSEPAVEELSRQILSQAKLWEAIQEARLELLTRKQQQAEKSPYRPLPLTGLRKRSAQFMHT